jgi:3-deoxy-7-phosphoheptulonate synthase
MSSWSPTHWRSKPVVQQPAWPDEAAFERVLGELSARQPLVRIGEIQHLQDELADVYNGKAFVLQAGDCAETFTDFSFDIVRNKLKIILQMAVVLTYSGGVPIVKIGRIAGQFAKPRSEPVEKIGDLEIPSFRGHIVSGDDKTLEARTPDPTRLLRAYDQSAETIDILRGLTKGGFADLRQVHEWNAEFIASSPEGRRYEELAGEVDRSIAFMQSTGHDVDVDQFLHEVDLYTSHEALLLGYEEALTREYRGQYFATSAHTVWIGERTRQLDGAHIDYAKGLANPIGVKIGPSATVDDVTGLVKTLNPDHIPGRLMFVSRMGVNNVREKLPPLVEAVSKTDIPIIWLSDPMHGNTHFAEGGQKTREFEDIVNEIAGFFSVLDDQGVRPGGIHVELTGEDVTECTGGSDQLTEAQLHENYVTACDPRLNARQSLDLAFNVAELLKRESPSD